MNHFILFILVLLSTSFCYSQAWETQTPTGDIPSARYGHSVVKIGDNIYIFGGRNSTTLFQDLYVYKINENDFDLLSPESGNELPPKRFGHAAVLYSGRIYIFGGMGESSTLTEMNDIWYYNPSTNLWTKENGTDPGNDLPLGRSEHQALVLDGVAYISGGYNANDANVSREFWTYNFSNRTWTEKGNLRSTRYGHSMFMDLNGRIYVYAGKGEAQILADALLSTMERYDSTSDEWDYLSTSNPPVARMAQSMVYTNNKMWIIGGRVETTRAEAETSEFWYFDIQNAAWTQKESGPTISNTGAAILEQTGSEVKIFVFGGQAAAQPNQNTFQYDSTADETDDDDDDDDGGNSISCGATGIEFLFFFFSVCLFQILRKK
ncbi:MAG: hypothetical protein HUU50_07330 [Candidatus Brocadiae bacterium]|nr:hypothetical protein [Candidatus Brocadiia bacterium]